MRWKVGGQVVAVDLDVDQMHGQGELVGVQHTVLEHGQVKVPLELLLLRANVWPPLLDMLLLVE